MLFYVLHSLSPTVCIRVPVGQNSYWFTCSVHCFATIFIQGRSYNSRTLGLQRRFDAMWQQVKNNTLWKPETKLFERNTRILVMYPTKLTLKSWTAGGAVWITIATWALELWSKATVIRMSCLFKWKTWSFGHRSKGPRTHVAIRWKIKKVLHMVSERCVFRESSWRHVSGTFASTCSIYFLCLFALSLRGVWNGNLEQGF